MRLVGPTIGLCLIAATGFSDTNDSAATPVVTNTAATASESAPAPANAELVALQAKLDRLETALTAQRDREVETLHASQHSLTMVLAAVSVTGVVGTLLCAGVLVVVVSRRNRPAAEPVAGLVPYATGYPLATAPPAPALAPVNSFDQSNARFLSAVERLEQRLKELEQTTAKSAPVTPLPRPAPRPAEDPAARVALLLGKGASLLSLQQAEAALACFEEIVALDPTNAEAFVRKGTALERLNRLDEAIDCYDQAIALDTSLTMAYLRKGGVFNRLERHSEAAACYEQALRAQQKTGVA